MYSRHPVNWVLYLVTPTWVWGLEKYRRVNSSANGYGGWRSTDESTGCISASNANMGMGAGEVQTTSLYQRVTPPGWVLDICYISE